MRFKNCEVHVEDVLFTEEMKIMCFSVNHEKKKMMRLIIPSLLSYYTYVNYHWIKFRISINLDASHEKNNNNTVNRKQAKKRRKKRLIESNHDHSKK